MSIDEQIQEAYREIEKMEKRIEFLENDKTVYRSAWHTEGFAYNHGPYLRRLEKRKLKAKIRRRKDKIKRLEKKK